MEKILEKLDELSTKISNLDESLKVLAIMQLKQQNPETDYSSIIQKIKKELTEIRNGMNKTNIQEHFDRMSTCKKI